MKTSPVVGQGTIDLAAQALNIPNLLDITREQRFVQTQVTTFSALLRSSELVHQSLGPNDGSLVTRGRNFDNGLDFLQLAI